MCEKITLTLDRSTDNLWIDLNGFHKMCLWDVTGLKLDEDMFSDHVRILRKGKQIGGAWNVAEIKEKW